MSHGPAVTAHRSFFFGRCALTAQEYPGMEDMSLQTLAVPTVINGIRDRNVAKEAMEFVNPESKQWDK